jgi:hypothetical protein
MTFSDRLTEILEKILPFIIALFILIVGFSFGEIKKVSGWETVAIAVLLSISIILFISILVMYIGGKKEKRFEELMKDFEDIMKVFRKICHTSKAPGILSEYETKEIEHRAKEEVWVITPSFRLDLGILKECIIDNLKGKNKVGGVTYKYLCPNNHWIRGRIADLIGCWIENGVKIATIKEQVEIKYISSCYIYGEIAIYDPGTPEIKALMFLPHTHTFTDGRFLEKYSNVFYIDDQEPATYFRDVFTGIWDGASEELDLDKFIKRSDISKKLHR